MDSLEINKACAAVLVVGIVFSVGGLAGEYLVHPTLLKVSAITVEGAAAPGASGPVEDPPVAALLAASDPKAGQALVAKVGCVACHSFNQGGKNGIGPNLYGVVGAAHGQSATFVYSAALKGKSGEWSFDELNAWLKKPSAFAPGTKMSYAGLADPRQRADIINYLHTLAETPVALPAAPPAAAAPAAAAAAVTAPRPAAPAMPAAAPAARPAPAAPAK